MNDDKNSTGSGMARGFLRSFLRSFSIYLFIAALIVFWFVFRDLNGYYDSITKNSPDMFQSYSYSNSDGIHLYYRFIKTGNDEPVYPHGHITVELMCKGETLFSGSYDIRNLDNDIYIPMSWVDAGSESNGTLFVSARVKTGFFSEATFGESFSISDVLPVR